MVKTFYLISGSASAVTGSLIDEPTITEILRRNKRKSLKFLFVLKLDGIPQRPCI